MVLWPPQPQGYTKRTVKDYQPGDAIGYARAFLKSTGMATDPRWSQRGKVVGPKGAFLEVQWADPEGTSLVHPNNIAKVGTAAWAD